MIEVDKNIFYENIDFLTFRIWKSDLYNTCLGLVENAPTLCLEFGFKIEFRDYIKKDSWKVSDIYDEYNNKLWQLRQKVLDTYDNSVNDELEFTSTFFVFYPEYLDYFSQLFSVDYSKNRVVARIDYAIDIFWYSVQDVMNNKKIIQNDYSARYTNSQLSWFQYKNQRHEVAIYNKPLEVLDKSKYKSESMYGGYPFKKWIETWKVITRLEVRKNPASFRDMEDSSFNYILKNIRSLSVQYLEKIFFLSCDSKSIPYNQKEKIVIDTIYWPEIARKKRLAMSRMESYMDSYIMLWWEKKIFDLLEKKFWFRLYMHLAKNISLDDVDKIFPNQSL